MDVVRGKNIFVLPISKVKSPGNLPKNGMRLLKLMNKPSTSNMPPANISNFPICILRTS